MKTLFMAIGALLFFGTAVSYGGSCVVSGSTARPVPGTVDIKVLDLAASFDSTVAKAGAAIWNGAFESGVFHPISMTLEKGFSSCGVGFLLFLR